MPQTDEIKFLLVWTKKLPGVESSFLLSSPGSPAFLSSDNSFSDPVLSWVPLSLCPLLCPSVLLSSHGSLCLSVLFYVLLCSCPLMGPSCPSCPLLGPSVLLSTMGTFILLSSSRSFSAPVHHLEGEYNFFCRSARVHCVVLCCDAVTLVRHVTVHSTLYCTDFRITLVKSALCHCTLYTLHCIVQTFGVL